MKLLHADPYELRGRQHAGKIHAIKEGDRTYCGTDRKYVDGAVTEGERTAVTCKGCTRSLDSADQRQREQAEWEERQAHRAAERDQANQEWWEWYSHYLTTPAWRHRRQQVLNRANGLCEGCRAAPPVHIHHLTYEHAGDELLYELVALCVSCHQKAHPHKEIGAA